ncbi:histone deacetylase family protein [Roseibacterium sp. SDUM158016]|jgi:acetoin utilization deacetylase AcuC-like enzyme|uniref:histone deacetylase family protein n=1 Tax=Roseicyclus sediminis TaxID=2980997 RepID=UPI0021D31D10|nr:histone deacetylase family protein [Roseibacterium sp. SDUM158016]MCU4652640.1 histone deacetylase family protein [Roseibacterium sp. SDUM158016]
MKTFHSKKHALRRPPLEYFRGQLVPAFEHPGRIDMILDRMGQLYPGTVSEPDDFGMAPVEAVHDPAYLDFLRTCWDDWQASGRTGDAVPVCWPARRSSDKAPTDIGGKMGYYGIAIDTSIDQGTWEAALSSKDAALSALRAVLGGERAAFGLCRPPGHHAARDQFGGYCFLNNAAIAAQYARDQGVGKVAIFDVDFHHGNGTQDIFYARDDVLFLSIHGDPKLVFPYFIGHEDEIGEGAGVGFNRNYVFPRDTAYGPWRDALVAGLSRVRDFGADLLIVSLGVDTFEQDPISFFRLHSEDFTDMGRVIAWAGLPTVFVLEGGYAVADIGVNVVNVLTGFESAAEMTAHGLDVRDRA